MCRHVVIAGMCFVSFMFSTGCGLLEPTDREPLPTLAVVYGQLSSRGAPARDVTITVVGEILRGGNVFFTAGFANITPSGLISSYRIVLSMAAQDTVRLRVTAVARVQGADSVSKTVGPIVFRNPPDSVRVDFDLRS